MTKYCFSRVLVVIKGSNWLQFFLFDAAGLHTEMALWNTLGDVLEGSGWTAALTQADVASSGTADSCLKATHLKPCLHHAIFAAGNTRGSDRHFC